MLDAFSDYSIPLQLGGDAFETMMRQRGLDRSRSRIAVVDGLVVSVWLVSVRGPLAYLISSGTRPDFRSRGISRALAEDCIDGLRKDAVVSFQTEVLRDNETAANLYYSLGMTRQRQFDCYVIPPRTAPENTPRIFTKAKWQDIAPSVGALRQWVPSWQNADQSLDAIADRLLCLASHDDAGLGAYAVVGDRTGAIHQLAVRQDLRRRGVGTDLIRAIRQQLPDMPLRLTNILHQDVAFRSLLACAGAAQTVRQYELAMQL
ncbi:GNAT family N-acetyltransferase [Profundibacter sp.]